MNHKNAGGYIMQYKTITISTKVNQKRKDVKDPTLRGTEYERIINEQAAEGWKLIGIHPINTKTHIGCMKFLLCGFLFGIYDHYQTDVFVFYKEEGTEAYTGPTYNAESKKSGEAMKKAGAAVAGAAQNAMNFMKSEDTANKLNSLKNKAMSSVSGIMNKSDGNDDYDTPEE